MSEKANPLIDQQSQSKAEPHHLEQSSRRSKAFDVVVLVLSVGTLAIGCILDADQQGPIRLNFGSMPVDQPSAVDVRKQGFEWKLECVWQSNFGIECPTCGMTRSVVSLLDANWDQSLAAHRLGWLVAMFIVLQIPYRLIRLIRLRSRRAEKKITSRLVRVHRYVAIVVLTAVIAEWIFRIS